MGATPFIIGHRHREVFQHPLPWGSTVCNLLGFVDMSVNQLHVSFFFNLFFLGVLETCVSNIWYILGFLLTQMEMLGKYEGHLLHYFLSSVKI